MEKERCYIDGRLCTGGRFSFCVDCVRAQRENEDEIRDAQTPLEITLAHIPSGPEKD